MAHFYGHTEMVCRAVPLQAIADLLVTGSSWGPREKAGHIVVERRPQGGLEFTSSAVPRASDCTRSFLRGLLISASLDAVANDLEIWPPDLAGSRVVICQALTTADGLAWRLTSGHHSQQLTNVDTRAYILVHSLPSARHTSSCSPRLKKVGVFHGETSV